MSWAKKIREKQEVPGIGTLICYSFTGDLSKVPGDIYCRNIEMYDLQGNLKWTIEREPHSDENDTYVGFIINGDDIEVISFGGIAYSLDVQTGSVTYKEERR